jgi:iron complex outermembrane receptor protein
MYRLWETPRRIKHVKTKIAWFVLLIAAGGMVTAQARTYRIDIPPQPLDRALEEFAEQSELQVVYLSEIVQDIESAGFSGEGEVGDVLPALLKGSGLAWRLENERTVSIVEPTENEDHGSTATEPPAAAVEGESPHNDGSAQSGDSEGGQGETSAGTQTPTEDEPAPQTQGPTAEEAAFAPARVIEEVIVTARKIDENLQTVPVAVTALNAGTIRELDIRYVTQTLRMIPGATSAVNTPSQQVYSIRGISSGSDSATADSGVLVMVDNEVVSRSFMQSATMYDVDRVEVLRGPQGTTFGRNSAGGVIHVLNRLPRREKEISGELTLGNYDFVQFDGVLNGAIGDSWAGRLSFHYGDRVGYSQDPETGETHDDMTNYSMRGQLLFEPNDQLSILLRTHYTKLDLNNPSPRKPIDPTLPYDSPFTSYQDPSLHPWDVQNSEGLSFERDIYGISGEIYWDIGDVRLSSITAYRHGDDNSVRDIFGTPDPLLDEDVLNDADTFSQELRFDNSAAGGRVSWLVGLFYLREEHFRSEDKRVLFDTVASTRTFFTQDNTTNSLGLFGEIDFALTDRTHLTVGGRYSQDEKDYKGFHTADGLLSFIFIPNPDDDPVQGTAKHDWSEPTYRVTLTHGISQYSMIYGSYATGFVAGGFNPEPANLEALVTPYDEETVNTLEVGIKSELLKRRLRLNMALFDSDFDDIQEEAWLPSGTPVTMNIAAASIRGVELEGTWLATDWLQLYLAYANYDHEYTEYINTEGDDLSGFKLQDVPDWTVNAGGLVSMPLSNGSEIQFRVDYRNRSDITVDAAISEHPEWGIREGKAILDARLSWLSTNRRWEIALWGRNLNEEAEISSISTQSLMSQRVALYLPPRTYGISARVSF